MKSSIRAVVALAATVVVAVGLTPGSALAAGQGWWPVPGFTPGNSGYNPAETTITAATVSGLDRDYSLLQDRFVTAPVVGGNRIYVAGWSGLHAYEEGTGQLLWSTVWDTRPVARETTSQLAIAGDRLISLRNHADGGSSLLQVFDLDGQPVARTERMPGTYTGMAVLGDTIVISAPDLSVTTAYRIECVVACELTPVWSTDATMARSVSANGRVLLAGTRDGRYRSEIRDIATGTVTWSLAGRAYQALAANDAGTRFYVSWWDTFQVLDVETGTVTLLGSNVFPQEVAITPTRIYTVYAGRITAFDATDGTQLWRRTFQDDFQKPAVAGGVLYLATAFGRTHVLDAETGDDLMSPLAWILDRPVVTDGKAYLTDTKGLHVYVV
ncbi:outer membrane protein assembly factor BamB family protein [Catenuloplanes atrovinosus]|uniref:Outer membrane protein assembly factor BamB n=1 Tax=Catenuloplanes atrovinosus TaxID=137266 RepID=A0AAE3YNM6_9ACTN|nr:PQQ-binding-like beta-propeller repeat protein [Catenuloplanes atrovinosus]MDR7277148.1 outer membrane protein assembly factor BamB [Catenuloplanes atrovinosus]